MEFKLNDYNRNTSDEEFLIDIKRVAEQLGQVTLTMDEYKGSGKFHPSTIRNRFDGWSKACELAGLDIMPSQIKSVDSQEMIDDLKRVALQLGKDTVSGDEYKVHGKFSPSTLIRRFGGWQIALQLAGLKIGLNKNFTDEDLLQEIERVWRFLGRQPTSDDIKGGISKYSLQSYSRRFGGWRGALQAFIDYINADEDDEIDDISAEAIIETPQMQIALKRRTKRDVNLRLRWKVMQRDNFKCCSCGASPAKDGAVELHVDHIMPWSKGGETEIENLQTLCSKCNFGKSDLL